MPEFKLSCMRAESVLLDIGLNTIMCDVKLVLSKHTLVGVNVIEPFVRMDRNGEVVDLVILK